MQITEQAADELRKVLKNYEDEGAGIRIFSAKGCCGPSIQMDVATKPNANQTVLNINKIDLFVDNDLMETMTNVTIDYGKNGFILQGLPKPKSSGCCS